MEIMKLSEGPQATMLKPDLKSSTSLQTMLTV